MVLLRIQTIYLNWWIKKIITLLHSKGLLILTSVVYAIMTSVVYAIIYKEIDCKAMFFFLSSADSRTYTYMYTIHNKFSNCFVLMGPSTS